MKKTLLTLSFISSLAFISFGSVEVAQPEVTTTAKCGLELGWMENGWGSISIAVTNNSDQEIKLITNQVKWEGEKEYENKNLDKTIAPNSVEKVNYIGHLSGKTIKLFDGKDPVKVGNIIYKAGKNICTSSYSAVVPVAVYDEPMVTLSGKYLGVTIRSRLLEGKPASKNMLKWMDDSYTEMKELTGGQPYNGDFVILLDAVPHPYWAYAGNPIVLNGKHVPGTLAEFCDGRPSFGWIHELGHDFDNGVGGWYNFNGPFCEFQANFKLVYALLHMPDRDIIRMLHGGNTYKTADKNERLKVDHWLSVFARYHGDTYLADSTKTWEEMRSDNYLSFFMRYVDVYGWDSIKEWYRTYRKLVALELTPPKTKEGKINLMCAILTQVTGVDQVPAFQLWKLPVTTESVAKITEEYSAIKK